MGDRFILYWTSLQRYEQCPRLFLWSRGWEDIDLGRGPGKRKKPKKPRSAHHAVMGSTIGCVIEDLYNQELWKDPANLRKELEVRVRRKFLKELNDPRRVIMWHEAPEQAEMLRISLDGVMGYLKTMKEHRLLGQWAKAEWEMIAYIDKYTPIGGRADVIVRRPKDDPHLPGLTILDGKNSVKQISDWNSPDQLRWYALCFYLAYGKTPDRIGFTYFRYPFGSPEVDPETGKLVEGSDKTESGVKWVPFDRDSLVSLAKRAKAARVGMHQRKFDPVPVPKSCKYCDFEEECPERMAQKKANSRGRQKRKADPLDAQLENLTPDKDGYYDLSEGGHHV